MSAGLPGRTDTVLVIDDEPASLHMIAAALENAGIAMLVATSGAEALALLDNILPDLILVDARMPGLDGFETTLAIKQRPALAAIPVIFMTGLTESSHVVEAFEVGGVDYLRKPVNIAELLARVRVHMAQARAVHASIVSLDAAGRLMIAVDEGGNLLWRTPRAEAVLARCCPRWDPGGKSMPEPLRAPLLRLLAAEKAGASAKVNCADAGRVVELTVVSRYRQGETLLRISEQDGLRHVARLGTSLRLTQREAEVLMWVSYGKSSQDISELLSISPRTVHKHLEHVFEKLGVESRAAAAAVAVRIMDG